MLEYEFEEVACDEVCGLYMRETAAHQKVILRRAADGWRYVGCIPKSQRRPHPGNTGRKHKKAGKKRINAQR